MGCVHPLGIDLIRNDEGEIIAGSCPVCGAYARRGQSSWQTIKQAFRMWLGFKP